MTTLTLFAPDDSHEITLSQERVDRLLATDAISEIEGFDPATPGEVGYTVNDEYALAYFNNEGPFAFLGSN